MRITHCSWLCFGSLVIILYSNTIIIDAIRHVHYLYFSLCPVEGTDQEHVQIEKFDAPEIAHVDGRGSTRNKLNMSRIHNSKSVRGRFLILTGCVSSYKSAMASWTAPFCQLLTSGCGCMLSKPMHQVRTMHNAATKLPYRTFPCQRWRHTVWRCVFGMLINVCLWSSEYKKITSKSSIIYHVDIIHVDYLHIVLFVHLLQCLVCLSTVEECYST